MVVIHPSLVGFCLELAFKLQQNKAILLTLLHSFSLYMFLLESAESVGE